MKRHIPSSQSTESWTVIPLPWCRGAPVSLETPCPSDMPSAATSRTTLQDGWRTNRKNRKKTTDAGTRSNKKAANGNEVWVFAHSAFHSASVALGSHESQRHTREMNSVSKNLKHKGLNYPPILPLLQYARLSFTVTSPNKQLTTHSSTPSTHSMRHNTLHHRTKIHTTLNRSAHYAAAQRRMRETSLPHKPLKEKNNIY